MKKLLFTYSLVCIALLGKTQQAWLNAKIDIKDAKSGTSINNGMAANFQAKKCFEIANGKLEFQYTQQNLADTIFIDAQGYTKYKITLADLLMHGKALLETMPKPTNIIAANFNKNESLNDYDNQTVFHWIGLPMQNQPFRYLQLGQVFENVHNGAQISKIRLNQLVFDLPAITIYDDGSINAGAMTYDSYPSATIFQVGTLDKGYMRTYLPGYLQSNKFKLRIYQLDANNQPVAELCTAPILLDREPPVQNMHISLSKYKITLPQGKFMVAVEWIPTQRNLSYITSAKGMYAMNQSLRPFIGVSEQKGKKLNVMALDYAGNWKPFDYLLPYYTDLALECEIDY